MLASPRGLRDSGVLRTRARRTMPTACSRSRPWGRGLGAWQRRGIPRSVSASSPALAWWRRTSCSCSAAWWARRQLRGRRLRRLGRLRGRCPLHSWKRHSWPEAPSPRAWPQAVALAPRPGPSGRGLRMSLQGRRRRLLGLLRKRLRMSLQGWCRGLLGLLRIPTTRIPRGRRQLRRSRLRRRRQGSTNQCTRMNG